VSAISSEFMRRVMRFEDAILSFLQSLSSSSGLAVYSPFRSVSASLRLPLLSDVGPSRADNGYQLVDLPCQPRGCGSEAASELSWQAITLSNSHPKTRVAAHREIRRCSVSISVRSSATFEPPEYSSLLIPELFTGGYYHTLHAT